MLVIAAGVICIANGLMGSLFRGTSQINETFMIEQYCSIIVLVLGVCGIASGIAAVVLRRVSPALAGAVMGMAGGGLVGFWLGLGALVLLSLSFEDF